MDENIVVCSACGGVNRLARGRSPAGAKCGKCGRKLFSAHPADVDGATFHRHRARTARFLSWSMSGRHGAARVR